MHCHPEPRSRRETLQWKFQIPKPKSQIPNPRQSLKYPNSNGWHQLLWELKPWDFLGIWGLGFGVSIVGSLAVCGARDDTHTHRTHSLFPKPRSQVDQLQPARHLRGNSLLVKINSANRRDI